MWVSILKDWHPSHTSLSKYFIERIKQRVDPTEAISNKHKTTNGFTLIYEILEVIRISKTRKRSLNRLISLIEESQSKILDSSIVNDSIVQKYYPDILAFLDRINASSIKDSERNYYEHNFKLFHERMLGTYFNNLMDEFEQINFNDKNFDRNSRMIDR